MTCWETLGLTPTPILAHIKQAYAKQLKITNPENKPEAFMRLNAAYKEALQKAKRLSVKAVKITTPTPQTIAKKPNEQANYQEKPQTPPIESIEQLQQRLIELSLNPKWRWNQEAWQLLLNEPVLMNIQTTQAALDACLMAITRNYFLPICAIRMLIAHSNFEQNKIQVRARLGQETFNRLQSIATHVEAYMEEDSLQLNPLNISPRAFHSYLRQRHYFNEALIYQIEPDNKLEQLFQQLMEINPRDFEVRLHYGRYLFFKKNKARAVEQLESIAADNPHLPKNQSYIQLLMILAEYYIETKQINRLPTVIQLAAATANTTESQEWNFSKYSAKYYAYIEEYNEAIVLLDQVLRELPHDYEARLLRTACRRHYFLQLQKSQQLPEVQAELLYHLAQYHTVISVFKKNSHFFQQSDSIFLALALYQLNRYQEMNAEIARVFLYQQQQKMLSYENIKKLCLAEAIVNIDNHTFNSYITQGLSEFTNPDIHDLETHIVACILFKDAAMRQSKDEATKQAYLNQAQTFGRIAYKICSDHNLLNYHYSYACYLNQDYAEVIPPLESYLTNNYSSFYALFRLGYSYLECKKYEAAIDRFERSLNTTRDTNWKKTIYGNLLFIFKKLGKQEKINEYTEKLDHLNLQEVTPND